MCAHTSSLVTPPNLCIVCEVANDSADDAKNKIISLLFEGDSKIWVDIGTLALAPWRWQRIRRHFHAICYFCTDCEWNHVQGYTEEKAFSLKYNNFPLKNILSPLKSGLPSVYLQYYLFRTQFWSNTCVSVRHQKMLTFLLLTHFSVKLFVLTRIIFPRTPYSD